jgi:hypothetical protein
MFDCANVEMRELLPDLVAGLLDAATRARVEEHVATCAECASELETLRLVRAAFASAPTIDARRVVAALPKPSIVARPVARPTPVKRWLDWRIAAALTTITVGGLSLAVSQRLRSVNAGSSPDSAIAIPRTPITPRIDTPSTVAIGTTVPRTPGTSTQVPAPTASRPKAQLSIGGGVSDMDDASLQALLGALDEIDRAPVAPSAEPDRSPVLPVIKGSDR